MQLLHKPITLTQKVIAGDKVGRTIGYPTANLKLPPEKIPFDRGVYAAKITLNNSHYLGIAYFGPRYLQKKLQDSLEIHIFNFSKDIYGQKITITLTHFVRPPKKFTSVDEAKKQLTNDIADMVKNRVVVVDKKDNTLDLIEKDQAHLGKAQLHRAISILIFNTKGEMLIQQRSSHKNRWPLFWANAVCSHPLANESYKEAAQRRLTQETGINTPLKFNHQFIYQAKYDEQFSEHELDHVFIGVTNKKPQVDSKEISQYKYLSISDIKKDFKTNPSKYTPWFKLIMKKITPSDILTS